MSNDSNIYAHKIFAEHPLGLWALDEDTHFLSIFTDTDRDLSQWSRSAGITAGSFSMHDSTTAPYPVLGNQVSSILKTSVSGSGSFYITSIPTFSITNTSDTVSIGFYYFKTTPFLTSIEIGRMTSGTPTYIKTITTSSFYEWSFASATFEGVTASSEFILKFNYSNPSGGDVGVLINGLTAGRWSQEYNMEYLGANSESLPAYMDTLIGCTHGIRAQKHGSDTGYGYYIIGSNGKLSARNASMPMVYGAYNSTVLEFSVNGEPSLIVPGNGFLLDSEKTKAKTFEAWLRIDSKATTPRKIIGPLSTNDGLYVNGPFFILRIGTKYSSYYVGEWNRPMLIQISTSPTSAQLFINGDQCISMAMSMADESLAELYLDGYGNVNDWIGLYAYDDVPVVEVDAIAIYPYQVDTIFAQRRFVMGEAVRFPESFVTAYSGEAVVPDYSFAKYANNQNYGSNQKSDWVQGTLNNFISESGILKTPKYSLPKIETKDATIQADYYNDLTNYLDSVGGELHFKMKPQLSGSKWSDGSHIFFDSISTILNKVDMIYVVGKAADYSSSTSTIFKIVNRQTGDYLKATLSGTSPGYTSNEINYLFKYGSNNEILLGTESGISTSGKYIAGINISRLSSYFSGNVSNFFSNQSSLKLYVGSNEDFSDICSSNFYGVGFGDSYNAKKVLQEFDATGLFNGTVSVLNEHKANYKFVPYQPFSSLNVDPLDKAVIPEISTSSYWKEDIPLISLAKYAKNSDGGTFYGIDYLQINFDYPHPISYSGDYHDTTDSMVKAYVSFQPNSSGLVSDLQDLSTTYSVPKSYYVEVTSDWTTSKYEVVNGTVINIPQGIPMDDLSIVIHIEANTDASITYPISIRSFEVAAQMLNSLSDTPETIGTKFGVDLVPFGYHSGQGINTILTTKRSDPYYYLSDQSGIKIVGDVSTIRGYYIPINPKLQEQFNIGGIQTTMKIEYDGLLEEDLRIFSISKDLSNDDLRFYLEAANGDASRARIYAVLFDGSSETQYADLEYYINGSLTNDPVIKMGEWFSLGINFTSIYSDTELTVPTIVNFNNDDGRINFYGPMLINNFSYFQLKKSEEEQRQIISRKWAQVEYTGSTVNTWTTWGSSTWSDVLTTNNESNISGLNAKELYGSFVGSNVISMQTESSQISPNCFRYDVHSNFVTTNLILSAL